MITIKETKYPIDGLKVIEPAVHGDVRGYFMETYNQKDMAEFGFKYGFCSRKTEHERKRCIARPAFSETVLQGKLVRVIKGCAFSGAYKFLKMRDYFVKNGKIHLISCFRLYFRFIPTRYTLGLRKFIVDVVSILLGNTCEILSLVEINICKRGKPYDARTKHR